MWNHLKRQLPTGGILRGRWHTRPRCWHYCWGAPDTPTSSSCTESNQRPNRRKDLWHHNWIHCATECENLNFGYEHLYSNRFQMHVKVRKRWWMSFQGNWFCVWKKIPNPEQRIFYLLNRFLTYKTTNLICNICRPVETTGSNIATLHFNLFHSLYTLKFSSHMDFCPHKGGKSPQCPCSNRFMSPCPHIEMPDTHTHSWKHHSNKLS